MRRISKIAAALILGVACLYQNVLFAQAPVIDASDRYSSSSTQSQSQVASSNTVSAAADGELYYQLQLLQQEVMELRGVVEEQSHLIEQLKDISQQRYIELDGRIADLGAAGGAMTSSDSANENSGSAGIVGSPPVVVGEGEREAYQTAYKLVINKQFDQALDAFKQFLQTYPDGNYAANALYWLGEIYLVIDPVNLDASKEAFTQLINQYPAHTKAPDAMYKLGKVYFLLGDKSAARRWLDKTISDYGQGSNATAAQRAREFIKENF